MCRCGYKSSLESLSPEGGDLDSGRKESNKHVNEEDDGIFWIQSDQVYIWVHMVTHVKTTCVIFCMISTLSHVDTEM